jgi:hypothetical protein
MAARLKLVRIGRDSTEPEADMSGGDNPGDRKC